MATNSVYSFILVVLAITSSVRAAPIYCDGIIPELGNRSYPYAQFSEKKTITNMPYIYEGYGCGLETTISYNYSFISLVDRGSCKFEDKAFYAQQRGASAVIVINRDNNLFEMDGDGKYIPSVLITLSDGLFLRNKNNLTLSILPSKCYDYKFGMYIGVILNISLLTLFALVVCATCVDKKKINRRRQIYEARLYAVNSVDEMPEYNCVICHEEMNSIITLSRLECDHVYHYNCISQWLDRRSVCPLCNKNLIETHLIADYGSIDA